MRALSKGGRFAAAGRGPIVSLPYRAAARPWILAHCGAAPAVFGGLGSSAEAQSCTPPAFWNPFNPAGGRCEVHLCADGYTQSGNLCYLNGTFAAYAASCPVGWGVRSVVYNGNYHSMRCVDPSDAEPPSPPPTPALSVPGIPNFRLPSAGVVNTVFPAATGGTPPTPPPTTPPPPPPPVPRTPGREDHSGVDIQGNDGDPVYAWRGGRVGLVSNPYCGNGVDLHHSDGTETRYCHFNAPSSLPGHDNRVRAGSLIGNVGRSGRATGFHVHVTHTLASGTKIEYFSALPASGRPTAEQLDENGC